MHWEEAKLGCVETVCGSQLHVTKFSPWTGRANQALIIAERAQSFRRVCPSVLSLSGATGAQLSSNGFHSSDCRAMHKMCLRAAFGCHTFQTALAPSTAALSQATRVTSHFSNICFSFFVFFPGINLYPQQTTALLKRGSGPFLQEQVTSAKESLCNEVARHRFQSSINVASREINVTFQCVMCEIYLIFPLQAREELCLLYFP